MHSDKTWINSQLSPIQQKSNKASEQKIKAQLTHTWNNHRALCKRSVVLLPRRDLPPILPGEEGGENPEPQRLLFSKHKA